MTMRVVECNICGETLSAESDEELKGRLGEHLGSAHDRGASPEELDELVASEAYEAMDS
jgi:predicted small metal-binding protein